VFDGPQPVARARPMVPVGPTAGGAASYSAVQLRRGQRNLGQKVMARPVTAIFRKMWRGGYQSDADVVLLMAKDCAKIAKAFTDLQFLWSGIFEAVGVFSVLISYIGLSALPG
jgi:hypothetical protein